MIPGSVCGILVLGLGLGLRNESLRHGHPAVSFTSYFTVVSICPTLFPTDPGFDQFNRGFSNSTLSMSFRNLSFADVISEGTRIVRAGLEGGKIAVTYGKPVLEKSANLTAQVSIYLLFI
jgi:hypothetical protein